VNLKMFCDYLCRPMMPRNSLINIPGNKPRVTDDNISNV